MNKNSFFVLQSVFGYILSIWIFSYFIYFSDYVPDWEKRFLHEPPQFEAGVLSFVMLFFTPIFVFIIFIIRYICNYITKKYCKSQFLQPIKKFYVGFSLLVFFCILSTLLLKSYIRSYSCCPNWQCRYVVWGFGISEFILLSILYMPDISLKTSIHRK